MGGHVEIQSKQGQGTTIRILLPLTLAILDGMSVRVADEVFILPLNAVMESLQPREEDLHPLAGGERVLEVRGEYLPLVELWKVFEVEGAKTEATQGIVVILQSAGRRYALLVDQLIGQHQWSSKTRKQLPQSARYFCSNDPRRRQRRADCRCLCIAGIKPRTTCGDHSRLIE